MRIDATHSVPYGQSHLHAVPSLTLMTILRTTLCVAAATAILGGSGATQIGPLDKQSTSKDAVCPLSDSQAQKSIDAFAKISPP